MQSQKATAQQSQQKSMVFTHQKVRYIYRSLFDPNRKICIFHRYFVVAGYHVSRKRNFCEVRGDALQVGFQREELSGQRTKAGKAAFCLDAPPPFSREALKGGAGP